MHKRTKTETAVKTGALEATVGSRDGNSVDDNSDDDGDDDGDTDDDADGDDDGDDGDRRAGHAHKPRDALSSHREHVGRHTKTDSDSDHHSTRSKE